MASPLNFYAEKVLSEHPISLWALDDPADFVSYISLANRTVSGWTITNGTFVSRSASDPNPPILSAPTSNILANTSTTSIILTSPSASFASTADTFTIAFSLYSLNSSITSIQIGYKDGSSADVYATAIAADNSVGAWKVFSANFAGAVTSGKVLIKINYATPNISTDFIINGLSVGYRSEEFNGVSVGQDSVTIPTSISTTQTSGVIATNYGTKSLPGYYIIDGQKLLARNSTIPMVYGASNSTVMSPHSTSGQPSLIIPGAGFMNEVNESMDMTFEAWVKVNVAGYTTRRIFGPLNSTDGLYANGPFLMLKVGKNINSHYVGEWFRPMLVQISISPSSKIATLTVNGRLIFIMNLDSVSFLTKYDGSSKDQDWLGFYAYSGDVPSIEVDCVAVYPYLVDQNIANRRYVYAQGVEFPKNIDVAYGGETVYSDYSFANYSNNYNYPEIGKWKNGIIKNAFVDTNYLSTLNLELPTLVSSNTSNTMTSLEDSLSSDYIVLPTESYFVFNSLNILQSPVKSIYGIFKTPATAGSSEQILMKLQDEDGNYIKISINGSTIYHKVSMFGAAESSIRSDITGVTTSKFIMVGIDIDKLKGLDAATYSKFFGNLDGLTMYIGGNSAVSGSTSTFTGQIHQVSFSDKTNYDKISSIFGSDGTVSTTTYATRSDTKFAHYPSYGLVANSIAGRTYIDIKTNSYWEDNVPVSLLSKYASPSNNYTLDFFQYNIDYPDMDIFSSGNYDTTNSLVKSYITFQYTKDGFKDFSTFSTTVSMPQNGEVTPDSALNWKTKKYEVVNNAVVYLPATFDSGKTNQDLSIVMHLDIYVNGLLNNPLKVKALQLAAKTLDSNSADVYTPINEIGTRFVKNLYPLTVESTKDYFDRKNSFVIGKDINQYLYLTAKTGFKLAGTYDSAVDRSLMFQLNENLADDFNINSINTGILYTETSFPSTARKILEIVTATTTLRFYVIKADSAGTRGKIYCNSVTSSGETLYTKLSYYWNGNLVDTPYINIKEWGMFGILFTDLILLNSSVGQVKITSNMMYNSFSYYQLAPNKRADQIIARLWSAIATQTWSTWNGGLWQAALTTSGKVLSNVSPSNTYQMLIGTNRLIFDADQYSGKAKLRNYKYSIFNNTKTVSQTLKPQ